MKKIKIAGILLIAISLATSCKQKFLEDIKSIDKYDTTMFGNEVLTKWYIDRMYYDYFSAYKSPLVTVTGLYNQNRTNATEEVGGTITDYTNPQKNLIDATNGDSYIGSALGANPSNVPYTRIRNCNYLLEKVDQPVGSTLTSDFKMKAKGQAFFLRGFQYFDLLRVYGGVPIVTKVQEASSTDSSIKLPRASVTEVVNQIVADFDSAAALLPATWASTDYGRFTKGAALAMKSRVLLTYASPLFNTDWDNTGNARWQKALDAGLAAEAALTAAGNGLYGTTAKNWAEMWTVNDNAFNKEAIIVRLLSNSNASSGVENNGWERTIRVAMQTGAGGISAPKEMIDLFPLADGSRPTLANGYDSAHFFLNRDPRFYRTFAFSGMKWPTKENTSDVVWLYRYVYKSGASIGYSDNNQVSSPAVVRKMTNPTGSSTITGLAYSGTDIFEYRYAELLLNIAECYAAKGDITNAVNYLKLIRQRVFPSSASANNYGIGTPASKYAAIEAVLYERRVELAYEGKRFWDLQRWMLYSDDASAGNTCTKLGVTPLNGTARNGRYWQYKTVSSSSTNTDPLTSARVGFAIDPDASDFTTQLNNLKTFFDNNIVVRGTDKPMDNISGTAVTFNFRPNYYLFGLTSTVLSLNPWLQQSIGWNDYSGAAGTFNARQ